MRCNYRTSNRVVYNINSEKFVLYVNLQAFLLLRNFAISLCLRTGCSHVYINYTVRSMEVKDIPPLVTAHLAGTSTAKLASLNFTSVGVERTRDTAICCRYVHTYEEL